MRYEAPCGCVYDVRGITFCSLHAAAKEMAETLKAAFDLLAYFVQGVQPGTVRSAINDTILKIDAALNKAGVRHE